MSRNGQRPFGGMSRQSAATSSSVERALHSRTRRCCPLLQPSPQLLRDELPHRATMRDSERIDSLQVTRSTRTCCSLMPPSPPITSTTDNEHAIPIRRQVRGRRRGGCPLEVRLKRLLPKMSTGVSRQNHNAVKPSWATGHGDESVCRIGDLQPFRSTTQLVHSFFDFVSHLSVS